MTVHVDRDVDGLLQPRHQFECDIRAQQPGHVLDADGVRAHVLDAFAHVDPQIDGMHLAHRVRHGPLRMFVDSQRCLDCSLEIAQIIQRVKNPENVDAVYRAALDELLDQIVGVMAIAEDVLTAKQHLLRRVGHRGLETTDALPRILTKVANAGVERGAAPGLNRPEANPVQLVRDRQHVVDAHACCQETLVRIAQHEFGDTEWFLIAHERESLIRNEFCDVALRQR